MTNIYVRVNRNGVWVNVEIDQLTDSELTTYFRSMDEKRAAQWAITLAAWIRDNVHDSITLYEEGEGSDG